MPHGVLFRGGAEGDIRQRIIEDDLLDTVIGLGPNLFYGTGIPAAILILRAKGSKPPERRGKVLFINADRDYREGRAQNHLRPRDEEKITAAYRGFADMDGFASVVASKTLAQHDFNCNIRRYADNAPPPEPQDVRAHLHGGVPMAEINGARDLLDRAGLDVTILFADRGDDYADCCHDVASARGRESAHAAISCAVSQQAAANPWRQWWSDQAEPLLHALPEGSRFVGLRQQLIESFAAHMSETGIDHFEAAGIAAEWWRDSFHELQTAASRGWKAVIEGWLTTAEANQDDKNAPDLTDQTAIKLLAGPQLASRAELAAAVASLDAKIKAAEATGDEGDEPDEDGTNPAELKRMKSERAKAKKTLKAIDASLLATVDEALHEISPAAAPNHAIGEFRSRIERLVANQFAEIERDALAWYDNLTNKYGTTLYELEDERDAASARLVKHLRELGYE